MLKNTSARLFLDNSCLSGIQEGVSLYNCVSISGFEQSIDVTPILDTNGTVAIASGVKEPIEIELESYVPDKKISDLKRLFDIQKPFNIILAFKNACQDLSNIYEADFYLFLFDVLIIDYEIGDNFSVLTSGDRDLVLESVTLLVANYQYFYNNAEKIWDEDFALISLTSKGVCENCDKEEILALEYNTFPFLTKNLWKNNTHVPNNWTNIPLNGLAYPTVPYTNINTIFTNNRLFIFLEDTLLVYSNSLIDSPGLVQRFPLTIDLPTTASRPIIDIYHFEDYIWAISSSDLIKINIKTLNVERLPMLLDIFAAPNPPTYNNINGFEDNIIIGHTNFGFWSNFAAQDKFVLKTYTPYWLLDKINAVAVANKNRFILGTDRSRLLVFDFNFGDFKLVKEFALSENFDKILSIEFFNSFFAVVTTLNRRVFFSFDGGLTWKQQDRLPESGFEIVALNNKYNTDLQFLILSGDINPVNNTLFETESQIFLYGQRGR